MVDVEHEEEPEDQLMDIKKETKIQVKDEEYQVVCNPNQNHAKNQQQSKNKKNTVYVIKYLFL